MPTIKKFFIKAALLVFIAAVLPLSVLFSAGDDFYSEPDADKAAKSIVSKMTIEQLAGQVMMIGYAGGSPSPEIISWIKDKNLGGIKIFGWNADSLTILTGSINRMKAAAKESAFSLPLLIATDQEGGWVRHIKGSTSITPGNMALGASSNISDAYLTGKYIGEELSILGINMNFAPAVDLLINHDAHVIGPRAFSQDPYRTAVLATSFINGMKSSGIITTAKHFPGHGRTAEDSHGILPVINVSLEELKKSDLVPYDFLIREDLPAIMSGHLAFPDITGDKTPASLSSVFLKDILRDEMGFKGIIITDDLQMTGALYKSNIALSSLRALKAGNDMILLSRNIADYESTRNLIISEMKKDRDFRKQISESAERIIRIKHIYSGIRKKPDKADYTRIPSPEASDFFKQQAFRSVSPVGYSPVKVPGKNDKILLAGQFRYFFEEGIKRFPGADTFYFPYRPFETAGKNELQNLPETADKYDVVIFCLATPGSLELLSALEKIKDKVIVFSVLSPAYLGSLDWIKSGVAVYGTGRESFTAGFSAVAGDFIPEGRLPIDIKGNS